MFNFKVKEENIKKMTIVYTAVIMLISLSATIVFSILFFSSIHIESILSSILVPGLIFPIVLYFLFKSQAQIDKLDQKLYMNTRKDLQTDTWNRRYFLELAEREFFVSKRYKETFSIVMFDVDDFKEMNEKHGHLVGDKILRSLAQTLANAIRTTDTLARYDGKRFTLLLPKISLENARVTALRLKKIVAESVVSIPDGEIQYTVSAGVVEYDDSIPNIGEFMLTVENKVSEAKKEGKNSLVG